MNIDEIIPLAVPIGYLLMFVSEKQMAGRLFPTVKNWKKTGFVFFMLLLLTSLFITEIFPHNFLHKNSLLQLSDWNGLGALIALLLTTFIYYWFHRAEHYFNWMWRVFHQLHHSAERIDVAGAFYTHPLEAVAKMTIGAVIASYVFGLSPVSTAIVSTISGLLSIFQHWNILTPHWLGYIIPRPESHCLHNELNVHARNYGDLPIWDILFGTYLNPRLPVDICVGFDVTKPIRLKDMLLMKSIE